MPLGGALLSVPKTKTRINDAAVSPPYTDFHS